MCYYRGIKKEQRMSKNRRRPHRGRREKKKKAGMLSNIILIVALAVFCVSAFQLVKIVGGYAKGRDEYKKIQSIALNKEDSEPEKGFSVNFDELKGINPDTVGWIRFYPEPSIINYPIVHLHKTFSENDNTLGTIFLNADNNANFNDRNSIIYGHRMKDGSMFRKLDEYKEKSFWEANPYFYIYTLDGRKLTYIIYAAGVTTEKSDVYQTDFSDDAMFQSFTKAAKSMALYDTGVKVTNSDSCVTLSTCTGASDEHRFVVIGVRVQEEELE